jgi:hypothetical protein
VDKATVEWRAPLLTKIVRQGIQEGVFTTAYPDQAGEIILSLWQGIMTAIERVLGAPSAVLDRTDAEAAKVWVDALRDGKSRKE